MLALTIQVEPVIRIMSYAISIVEEIVIVTRDGFVMCRFMPRILAQAT